MLPLFALFSAVLAALGGVYLSLQAAGVVCLTRSQPPSDATDTTR